MSTVPSAPELRLPPLTWVVYVMSSGSTAVNAEILVLLPHGQSQEYVPIFVEPSYRSKWPSVPDPASSRPHVAIVAAGAPLRIVILLISEAEISASFSGAL